MLLIVLDAGLRTGEFTRLNLADVALDSRYLEIHESKWNNSRVVPFSKPVVVALRRYLRWGRPKMTGVPTDDAAATAPLFVGRAGVRLTENGLYQAVRRAYRRGGGEGSLGLHAFRRLCAAHTQDQGVDQRVTQDNMGHEDARVTKLYAGATRIDTAPAALSGKPPLALLPSTRAPIAPGFQNIGAIREGISGSAATHPVGPSSGSDNAVDWPPIPWGGDHGKPSQAPAGPTWYHSLTPPWSTCARDPAQPSSVCYSGGGGQQRRAAERPYRAKSGNSGMFWHEARSSAEKSMPLSRRSLYGSHAPAESMKTCRGGGSAAG